MVYVKYYFWFRLHFGLVLYPPPVGVGPPSKRVAKLGWLKWGESDALAPALIEFFHLGSQSVRAPL